MKTIYYLSILLFIDVARAEPQPWGIIIKGSQCAKFWAGDECSYYKVPKGWTEKYGDYIKVNGKQCNFLVGHEKECCEKLGFKFVDLKLEKDTSAQLAEVCKLK